jgi:hypothetical protein
LCPGETKEIGQIIICVFFTLCILLSSLSPIAQSSKSKKKAKKDDSPKICDGGVHIEMAQELSMSFQLKYLISISKCAVLSDHVQLMLKNDNPLLVSNVLYLWEFC